MIAPMSLRLDERLQARQRVVPLRRHGFEIRPRAVDGLSHVAELTFAPDPLRAHDAGALEHAQVLRHTLPREIEAVGKLGDRARLAIDEAADELQPRRIAERRENRSGILQRANGTSARHTERCSWL